MLVLKQEFEPSHPTQFARRLKIHTKMLTFFGVMVITRHFCRLYTFLFSTFFMKNICYFYIKKTSQSTFKTKRATLH